MLFYFTISKGVSFSKTCFGKSHGIAAGILFTRPQSRLPCFTIPSLQGQSLIAFERQFFIVRKHGETIIGCLRQTARSNVLPQ